MFRVFLHWVLRGYVKNTKNRSYFFFSSFLFNCPFFLPVIYSLDLTPPPPFPLSLLSLSFRFVIILTLWFSLVSYILVHFFFITLFHCFNIFIFFCYFLFLFLLIYGFVEFTINISTSEQAQRVNKNIKKHDIIHTYINK